MSEKYNEDNFLNQTTMTVARATVCSTVCVFIYDTAAQTKIDTAAHTEQ